MEHRAEGTWQHEVFLERNFIVQRRRLDFGCPAAMAALAASAAVAVVDSAAAPKIAPTNSRRLISVPDIEHPPSLRFMKRANQSVLSGRLVSASAAPPAITTNGTMPANTVALFLPAASRVAANNGPATEPKRPNATAAPTPVPRLALG